MERRNRGFNCLYKFFIDKYGTKLAAFLCRGYTLFKSSLYLYRRLFHPRMMTRVLFLLFHLHEAKNDVTEELQIKL